MAVIRSYGPHGIASHVPEAEMRQLAGFCLVTLLENSFKAEKISLLLRPTVCLDVMSLVASSCGDNRGEIAQRVAHEFTAHVATQRGIAERSLHRHPPRAQPVAPMR
jgi:hypothetical protein